LNVKDFNRWFFSDISLLLIKYRLPEGSVLKGEEEMEEREK
jgi:hypothetical protein